MISHDVPQNFTNSYAELAKFLQKLWIIDTGEMYFACRFVPSSVVFVTCQNLLQKLCILNSRHLFKIYAVFVLHY